jgi:hypothetical protein
LIINSFANRAHYKARPGEFNQGFENFQSVSRFAVPKKFVFITVNQWTFNEEHMATPSVNPFLRKGNAITSYFFFSLVIGVLLFLSIDCKQSIDAANHDGVFNNDKLLAVRGNDLKRTVVTATMNAPFEQGKNMVWCGTFQLAWNEACTLVGEDLHFDPDPPIVAELDQKAFRKDDLDAASYVALAGFVKDGIHQKIRQSLQEKFGGGAKPGYIPSESLTPRPQDLVAYSYLFKNLEFAVPFERLEKPLRFGYGEISAFGMGDPKRAHEQMAPQVLILDYTGPDDFVIELKTKSQTDRLILAKVQPKANLAETVAEVKTRSNSAKPQTCMPEDKLAVPRFNFDIVQTYNQIEGLKLVVQNPKVAGDLQVLSAVQDIRFQMDEKGVILKSESHITFACAKAPSPSHVLVFDKPFLVFLERTNATTPYLAMWIDNSELLVRW